MNGNRPIYLLSVENFLSYGSPGVAVDLLPLNVLIGPNASGKSNLIEALSILGSMPLNLANALREGGGVGEYVRKGEGSPAFFRITANVDTPDLGGRPQPPLLYTIQVAAVGQRPEIVEELVGPDVDTAVQVPTEPPLYYSFFDGHAIIWQAEVAKDTGGKGVVRALRPEDLAPGQSVLSQRRDPELYPQLTHLGDLFGGIAVFRDWTFGSRSKTRAPQPADLPTDFLLPDASNLALVLHEMQQRSATRKRLIEYLRRFYSSAHYIATKIQGGTVQLFIEEGLDELVPATRLSDGTLRYLSLLAVLCHPSPPPIVCIEEPELGLHPDILPTIAELLRDASQRTQLVVTTHSDSLVSALSDTPEVIVVCEPGDDGTQLRRLDKDALSEWLNRYSLGEIWRMGEIGGTRW